MFLNMIIQLHKDQLGQIRHGNVLTQPFPIADGFKQGYVLAPTLFTLFFNMMLREVTEDLDDDEGKYGRFHTVGSLFNLRCLQAQKRTVEQLIRDLLFADNTALLAQTETALQRITSCFEKTAQLFGLEVSLKKNEVLH